MLTMCGLGCLDGKLRYMPKPVMSVALITIAKCKVCKRHMLLFLWWPITSSILLACRLDPYNHYHMGRPDTSYLACQSNPLVCLTTSPGKGIARYVK